VTVHDYTYCDVRPHHLLLLPLVNQIVALLCPPFCCRPFDGSFLKTKPVRPLRRIRASPLLHSIILAEGRYPPPPANTGLMHFFHGRRSSMSLSFRVLRLPPSSPLKCIDYSTFLTKRDRRLPPPLLSLFLPGGGLLFVPSPVDLSSA